MIKNVVFDIGGVLAYVRREDFFTDRGIDSETARRIRKAYIHDWAEFDRNVLPYREVVDRIAARDPELTDVIHKVFSDMSGFVRMFDYTVPWIEELKGRGLKVYYLSNWPGKVREDCPDALAFLPHTHGGIFSYQEKVIKPDPEIYRRLLDRYSLTAGECVFIDDLTENVEAARRMGFNGIVFTERDEVVGKLEELLEK